MRFPWATYHVCCFQYETDAKEFYEALKERLAKFNLEVEESKTKIIPFGRFAANRKETFDFLGFTHYASKSKNGKFRVKRKTIQKKFRAKLREFKTWIKSVRNLFSIAEIIESTKARLRGHFQYYGITDNSSMLKEFKYRIEALLFRWLNRRSQRKSFSLDKFNLYLKMNPLPIPRISVSIYE